jgi:hypothetical protein
MEGESVVQVLNQARTVNSQLMKTNLGLLMAIREADCDIVRARKLLQKHHEELIRRGVSISPDCLVQTKAGSSHAPRVLADKNDPENTEEDAKDEDDNDEDNDDDQNSDSSSNSSDND